MCLCELLFNSQNLFITNLQCVLQRWSDDPRGTRRRLLVKNIQQHLASFNCWRILRIYIENFFFSVFFLIHKWFVWISVFIGFKADVNKCIYLMLMFCFCISFIRAVLSQHDSEYYNYTNAANNDTITKVVHWSERRLTETKSFILFYFCIKHNSWFEGLNTRSASLTSNHQFWAVFHVHTPS